MEDSSTPDYRISLGTAGIMIGVALLYDGAQIILTFLAIGLAIDWVFDVIACLHFYIWFKMKDIDFVNKVGAKFFGIALIELFPVLNNAPGLTLSTILVIRSARKEDRKKHREEVEAVAELQTIAQARYRQEFQAAAEQRAANNNAARSREQEEKYAA